VMCLGLGDEYSMFSGGYGNRRPCKSLNVDYTY